MSKQTILQVISNWDKGS